MQPFWPECDMGGGGDGGGPAAESPVRTVAVVLVTVRPNLPGGKWLWGVTGGCAGGIPADVRLRAPAVGVGPALPAPPRLRAVLAGPDLLVTLGGAAAPRVGLAGRPVVIVDSGTIRPDEVLALAERLGRSVVLQPGAQRRQHDDKR